MCHKCHINYDVMRKSMEEGFDGYTSSLTKLTEQRVRDIRTRYANGESVQDLAREYNIGKSAAYLAIKGKTWKWVTLSALWD